MNLVVRDKYIDFNQGGVYNVTRIWKDDVHETSNVLMGDTGKGIGIAPLIWKRWFGPKIRLLFILLVRDFFDTRAPHKELRYRPWGNRIPICNSLSLDQHCLMGEGVHFLLLTYGVHARAASSMI